MSAESTILRGRAAAIRLMIDACTIKRLSGQSTNLQTAVVTDTYTTLYSGKCRIQRVRGQRLGSAHPAIIGAAQIYQQPLAVHVPVTVLGIILQDIVTVTASLMEPDLVGRSFWVQVLPPKTLTTAHRYGLQEVTS
jgi:hypothetical protein